MSSNTPEPPILKPCPFCGGAATQDYGHGGGWVPKCELCGVQHTSVRAWNTRVNATPDRDKCGLCGKERPDGCCNFRAATSGQLFEALGKSPEDAASMERGLNAVIRREDMKQNVISSEISLHDEQAFQDSLPNNPDDEFGQYHMDEGNLRHFLAKYLRTTKMENFDEYPSSICPGDPDPNARKPEPVSVEVPARALCRATGLSLDELRQTSAWEDAITVLHASGVPYVD